MAVVFNAAGEAVKRLTNLIQPGNDATYSFFHRKVQNPPGPPNYYPLFYWGDDPSLFYTDYIFIGYDLTGSLSLEVSIASAFTNGAYLLPDNGLYFITYVRSGSSHKLYVNGILRISFTKAMAAMPVPTHQYVGTDTFVDTIGDFAYYLEYNVAFTATEVVDQMNSPDFAVVKTANLWANTPFTTDILDISGNGYNWSLYGGAVTFTTGVLNQSAVYARPLSAAPVAYNQNAHSGAITYDLWYRYQPLSNVLVLKVFGFGDLVTYLPKVSIQIGTLGALAAYKSITNIGPNLSVQIPIPAQTPNFYYFKFSTNAGNPTPAVLLLDIGLAPQAVIPAEALFVNDDTSGFPGVFLSAIDGTILNFISPFPNGEGGDVLLNGYMLFEDFANNNLKSYSNQFVLDQTIAFGNGFVAIRANETSNTFFAANNDNPTSVRQINAAGAVINSYALTGNVGINAVVGNNNDTILYYARRAASAVVKRWDLVGNVAMADFLAADGTKLISDMLYLPDDTILIAYVETAVTFIVKQYNPAGTLLNTYNLTTGTFPSGTQPRLAYSHDASLTFWAWSHDTGGISRFRRVRISDGVAVVEFTLAEYESGIYQGSATGSPTDIFGPSFSCPFIALSPSASPPGVPTTNPPGTIIVGNQSTTGGLYEIVYNARKLNDTLWIAFPSTTQDVKKPDPTAQTGDFGE